MPISLSHADKARETLTKEQQRQIKSLYSQVSKDIQSQISKLDTSTASGSMRIIYLQNLEKQVNEAMENVGKNVEKITVNSMLKAANLVGDDISSWLSKYNVQIAENYSHVANDIVESLATGQLYEGDWTLSSAIWKNIKENQNDINMIMAKGIAENKSVVDIAKDLANYTNPHKLTKWNLVAPDGRRVLRSSVDYRAQRLARTMVSHAYQQSFIRATEKNPFVIDYVWVSSNGGRTCQLCADRDGQHYTAKDLPLDHPNGMCTWIANTKSDDEIIEQLADWVNGGEDEALDEYAKSLGFEYKHPKQANENAKDTSNWYSILKSQDTSKYRETLKSYYDTWISDKQVIKNISGVKNYTGKGYEKMNSYLRGRVDSISKSMVKNIDECSKALSYAKFPEDIMTRRISTTSSLSKLTGIPIETLTTDPSRIKGMTIVEKGFLSTSPTKLDYNVNGMDVEWIIKVPKGTEAAYVDPISFHKGEEELLINKGKTLIINNAEVLENNKIRVFMEIIN